ncbi:hypothetical protein H8959_004595 [Pygathrix nigripes]
MALTPCLCHSHGDIIVPGLLSVSCMEMEGAGTSRNVVTWKGRSKGEWNRTLEVKSPKGPVELNTALSAIGEELTCPAEQQAGCRRMDRLDSLHTLHTLCNQSYPAHQDQDWSLLASASPRQQRFQNLINKASTQGSSEQGRIPLLTNLLRALYRGITLVQEDCGLLLSHNHWPLHPSPGQSRKTQGASKARGEGILAIGVHSFQRHPAGQLAAAQD